MLFLISRVPRSEEDEDDAAEIAFTAGIFRRACVDADLKQETIGRLVGKTPAKWNDQLAGRQQQHPSFRRLLRLRHDPDGRRFLEALMLEMAMACGMDLRATLGDALLRRWDELHVALKLARASLPKHRGEELEKTA
jgi:hypothetical protein